MVVALICAILLGMAADPSATMATGTPRSTPIVPDVEPSTAARVRGVTPGLPYPYPPPNVIAAMTEREAGKYQSQG